MELSTQASRRRCTRIGTTTGTTMACLALLVLQSGCAATSLGDQPLLQETLAGRCQSLQLKECVVWGGNKFRKRYEYCGCRDMS